MQHVGEFYNYVEGERFQKEALKRLRERIDAGESAAAILGIDPAHKFYIDKICNGLIRLSYELYDRIMGCSKEDLE